MARALVEVVGDSASAVKALEQTTVALGETGDAAKKMAVDVDAAAAAMTRMSATRAESLLATSAALKQQSVGYEAGSTEQLASNELALKKQTQAYKLLGIQAASTGASVTKTAGTIGRGLTTYVTAPTAIIGYEAVKQALDYNQALLLIRTQAGASDAELQHMNTAVLQLAASGKSYGQTAQQMAQGLYFVESEGIRGGRALALLQAAAAGAAKGQTSMADTTNALTSAMKIWNVGAGGAVKTMATIDAITATGKMHLEDLNNAFQTKFFTTSKQLGIPLEEAGAALDVFTKAGVPAEVAANNMTTSFIKMVTPAKAAVPFLQQLGLSATSLGQDLQQGGLSQALEALSQGYEHLIESSGKRAANQAVLESFGGSRSGAPALALVQQYSSYLQSLGEIQRLNNPATFWSQVGEAMHTPAMQIKQDVAEISADFIKLGTALAPTVATIAGGVARISSAFGHLPGPVKDAIGVVVGLLAIGGPLGLAVSGVGKLIDGIGAAFRLLPISAGPAAAATAAEVEGVGAAASTATGEVGGLRLALMSLGSPEVLAALAPIGLALGVGAYFAFGGGRHNNPRGPGPGGHQDSQYVFEDGRWWKHGPRGALTPSAPPPGYGPHSNMPRPDADAIRARARAEDAYYRHHHHHDRDHPPGPKPPPPDYFTTTIPTQIQLRLARAQASGNTGAEQSALEQEKKFLQHEERIARTSAERLAALQAEATVTSELATLQNKTTAAAKKTVTQDQLYAQARLDLANGELGAARSLLEKDKARLQRMLAEADTSAQRLAITDQLEKVDKLLHTKSDQFALSPALQAQIAKADALAALDPSNTGPDARQIQLAKQAKAAALKAIHSHELTMQGLIAAWQIVQQENSVLASAMGMINTYHAESAAAIVGAVKGLSQAQQLQLRERIAQAEAHRGHVPNVPGSHPGHPHDQHVHVHVHSNDSHIVKVVSKHDRTKQRAGGRR